MPGLPIPNSSPDSPIWARRYLQARPLISANSSSPIPRNGQRSSARPASRLNRLPGHPASQLELAMTAVEELERVNSLLNKGALTADEATTIKAEIIDESFKGGMPVLDEI